MIVTKDYLLSVSGGLRKLFIESLAKGEGLPYALDIERITETVKSTDASETYQRAGFPPQLSEWVDRRQRRGTRFVSKTIENKRYSALMEVELSALEDDKLGHIRTQIELQALRYKQFKRKQLVELLAAGFSTLCDDGQYLIDTDHSEGDSGTQSNRMTSGAQAFSATNFAAACQRMMGFKDDAGEYLELVPDLLIVGPDLMDSAITVLNSDNIIATGLASTSAYTSGGDANVNKGRCDLAVNVHVPAGYWFVCCSRFPVKPLIWQDRTGPTFQALTDLNSDAVIETDKLKFGVRCRSGKGTGLWHLVVGSNNA